MNLQTVNVEILAKNESFYPIFIGENLLQATGDYVKQYTNAKKVAVVTNTTVNNLYGKIVQESLDKAGFISTFIVLEDGEKYKNINSLNHIWDKALEFRLERKDVFIALGGGVIGDITGFAASSYLRGIDFVQIPTTLLAQVDSSVGGKVAINHPLGKNMIGAFYQPKLVLADVQTLKTLPLEELKTGLAEVLKYAFIENSCGLENKMLFAQFLKENKENIYDLNSDIMIKLITHCCKLKAAVVNQDEKEAGLRAILNFGHTIGHAIEKCTDYEMFTHGQAVAMGMKGAFYIAKQLNPELTSYYEDCLNLIQNYELDYKIPESIEIKSLLEAMQYDKKVLSGKVRFILPKDNYEVEIRSDTSSEILSNSVKILF